MRNLIVALVALLFAGEAFAADGAYPNATCSTSDTVQTFPTVKSGGVVSFCPVSTLAQLINARGIADCNWNADTTSSTAGVVAGQATLTANKCSGSTTAASDCKNTLLNTSTSSPTITSGAETGRFALDSGAWLITASAAAANGILTCTGR